ncbi:MAG: universal stress protein [Acidobacteria bacterium]|nr:universal stress protein [Acidobacteriota bacterium]
MAISGPVLVATSLSDADDELLRQGHAVASGIGAPLVVCHVLPEAYRVRVLFPQCAGIDASVQAPLEGKARDVVNARVADVLGAAGDATIELESGSPHAAILEVAERTGAGLIVVGPGATASRVARSAACPVLIARPSAPGGVLGATDFSDASLPAVRLAADEARRRGVTLRLVHSTELDAAIAMASAGLAGGIPLSPIPEDTAREIANEARERLLNVMAESGATGDVVVLSERPGAGIIAVAEEMPATLVVVGTRGRSGVPRLLMGSVAEEVVSRAPCSVFVVPLHLEA